MPCNEALQVHAYFDGELDASAALALEQHLETCADCAQLLASLHATRTALREHAPYYRASDELRDRVSDMLRRADSEGARQRPPFAPIPFLTGAASRSAAAARMPFLSGAASGAAATALAAGLALFLIVPPASNALVGDVMNAHLRSMMSDHLIDVVSSDRHTVKPWFAGHTDVSPPAVDFEKEGYKLVGGRADYVYGHRAAVVVYRHGAHVINVFAWAHDDERLPATASRNGYQIAFWRRGGLNFCAVSDTGPDELQKLVHLVQQASGPDHT
jgi:anti-sigma factor RsiW